MSDGRHGANRQSGVKGWCVLFAWFLLLGAFAQMGRSYPTIESRVGEAQVVVRGHIVKVEIIELAPKNGVYDKTSWPDGWYRTVSTIRVEETIKGKAPASFRVERESHGLDGRPANWMAYSAPMLFFLPVEPKTAPLKDWDLFRMAPISNLEPPFYGSDWTAIPSMDLTVLQTSDQILKRARDFARRHPGKVPTVVIDGAFQGPHLPRPADANSIILPLVPEIGDLARRMAASKDRYRREQGQRILKQLGG